MSNQAAWLTGKQVKPLEVGPAELYKPDADEVLIKNAAVGVAPADWIIQDSGFIYDKFPAILGTDVAGEIADVGANVTRFSKGQRVLGHCIGLLTTAPRDGGFQLYSICKETLVAPIPDSMSFEQAAVLPLAVSTAALGLYQQDILGLPLPTKDAKPNGKTLFVYGGSSSVGSIAIQLAIASGFEVISTASKHNFDYVKSLGAKSVIDHTSPNMVDEAVTALKQRNFAGIFDSISNDDCLKTLPQIAEQLGGGRMAIVRLGSGGELAKGVFATTMYAAKIAAEYPHIAEAVWVKWLPEALADGRMQAKPDPLPFDGGLSSVQAAIDRQKQGVSAKKVVVRL